MLTFLSNYDIDLVYNLKTAHWTGDDYNYPYMSWADPSGYGRLNGCDDNSIYQQEQRLPYYYLTSLKMIMTGIDIPYWTEVNRYHTDPQVNDTGRDDDGDGVPIEWEFKWGTLLIMIIIEQTWSV